MTVRGFTVDVRHADVTMLGFDAGSVVLQVVVPETDVLVTMDGDTRLVTHRVDD